MGRPKSIAVEERRERVHELHYVHGMKMPEIARELGVSLRLVRDDITEIRKTLSAEQVLELNNPRESRIFTQRMEFVIRHAAREMEKLETTSTSTTRFGTGEKKREVVTTRRGDRSGRERWADKYIAASKAIATVNGVRVDPRGEVVDPPRDPATGGTGSFEIVMTGAPMDELISLNVEPGKEN